MMAPVAESELYAVGETDASGPGPALFFVGGGGPVLYRSPRLEPARLRRGSEAEPDECGVESARPGTRNAKSSCTGFVVRFLTSWRGGSGPALQTLAPGCAHVNARSDR